MAKFQTAFGPHRVVNLNQEGEVTMTHQSFKNECDINLIISKFEKTGLIEHVNKVHGNYGDFIDSVDYQYCMNQVLEARESFSSLPSKIRKRFDNDPRLFLEFAQDERNRDEMIELGLIQVPTTNVNVVQAASELSGGTE